MNNGDNNNQNPNRRYVGKIREQNGQYGPFKKFLVDNPSPTNQDGTPNQYHKGVLLWCDQETGKKYLVKSMSLKGVPEGAAQRGFVNSICLDLDNEYDVQDLG